MELIRHLLFAANSGIITSKTIYNSKILLNVYILRKSSVSFNLNIKKKKIIIRIFPTEIILTG